MGKSTLSKFLFLEVVENGHGIPIYIELRRLSKKNPLMSEIITQLRGLNDQFEEFLVIELFKRGDFIFFLDGFDEVSSANRDDVVNDLKNFIIDESAKVSYGMG